MKFSLSMENEGSTSVSIQKAEVKPAFDRCFRPIVCMAGIAFFGIGIWMMVTGITAQGLIDIELQEVFTGHLETGSAGLFIVFLSFFLILVSLINGEKPIPRQSRKESRRSRIPVILTAAISFWIFTLVTSFAAVNAARDNSTTLFGILATFVGIPAISFTVGVFTEWYIEVGDQQNRQDK